ncbi:MAG: cell division ATP-binding protein FtsE [Candidatus Cyclonatronum sp.]|uniref:cell division ATP-binding protein FtsE n=1 Tax=Cyclonatronum sp. TaxID=3024185 RepID=UPI0025C6582F|nr:cell division ATP-binding protein FtsE [Cyclonatronum sp.]MCC5933825.1 cell division ATP-binding protein FtsE [Balneolales bacterium]MCH8488036.1 cell division ATP-binding protein FtsE [Cyclonatronum sp.]
MSQEPVIEFRNVTVRFDGKSILEDLDFSLGNGEFCYLIGATGSGKSSLLRLIYRDLMPDFGDVLAAGEHVTRLRERDIPFLRRKLGIVFQDFQLLPDRSVYENVAFALEVTGNKRSFIRQRVLECLAMVGLSHKHNNMPGDLSGGEQQRVVIARALANEPRIMLADEPTGNLDPEASASIMELLMQINNRGMAILMVTHSYDLVRQFPHRTVKLVDGKLREIAPGGV